MLATLFVYVIKLLLIAGPVFLFIEASCPNGETSKTWRKRLRKHAAATFTADEHRYAAILVAKMNRRFERLVFDVLKLTLKPFSSMNLSKNIPDGISILVLLFGPFVLIFLLDHTENLIILSLEVSFYLSATVMISALVAMDPDFAGVIDGKTRERWICPQQVTGWRRFVAQMAVPIMNRSRRDSDLGFTFCVSFSRMQIFSIVAGVGLIVHVVNTMLKIPRLNEWLFFGLYVPFGMYLSMLFSFFLYLGTQLPRSKSFHGSRGSWSKHTKYFLITTLSMYLSTILIYVSRYDNFFAANPESYRIVLTNVLCDLFVYWRFQQFVTLVRKTRRKDSKERLVVLLDFLVLLFVSSIMSMVSIYIGFFGTDQHLSTYESFRLFVGLDPVAPQRYLGTVFWLVHTTFIPIAVFSAIPVVLIASRFLKMIYHNVIVRVSLKEKPLVYLASFIGIVGAVWEF